MIKTVPVVRGVAPLVDLAAPDVEALRGLFFRSLGGADGCNCEESDHFASWGLPSPLPAGSDDEWGVKSASLRSAVPVGGAPARIGLCSDRGLPQ